MKRLIHKIRFRKPDCRPVSEGFKLCTGKLANQKCEEFSYWWRGVNCPDCKRKR